MGRTTGAVNRLIKINMGAETWYFPRVYLEELGQIGMPTTDIQAVVLAWIQAMEARGWTPASIQARRADIDSHPDSQTCIAEAVTARQTKAAPATAVATPAKEPDDEPEDEEEFDLGPIGIQTPVEQPEQTRHPHAANVNENANTNQEPTPLAFSIAAIQAMSAKTPTVTIVPKWQTGQQVGQQNGHTDLSSTVQPATAEVAVASAQAIVTAAKPGTTNDQFFHGMPRQIPKHPDTPKMHGIYVNGDNPTIDKIYAGGKYALLFMGPTACGKTEKAKHLAFEAGTPCVMVGHDAHTEVEDLLGKIMPTGNPEQPFAFMDGPLTQAFEKGWTYIADEINAVKAGVLMIYNQINNMEDLLVRTDGGVRRVPRHPMFRLIATCNPPTSYQGLNEMNLAQLRRFIKFNFDYPEKTKETEIISKNYPKMDTEAVESLIDFANEIRAKQRKDPDNTRYTVHLAALLKICYLVSELHLSVREAVDISILNEVESVDQEEYDQVRIMVESTFPYVETKEDSDPINSAGIKVFGGA